MGKLWRLFQKFVFLLGGGAVTKSSSIFIFGQEC